jgi:hypothetical protein
LKNSETDAWELQATNIAPFTAFDRNTGGLTVLTLDKTLARMYSIKWRIEDLNSNSLASFDEVTFELTVISICTTNMISASGSGLDDKTYYLGNDQLTVLPQ